ncbi:MAG: response regulator [Fibrobacter sp.]|nr:response regulator [Fibrobacter sp.]
MELDNQLPDFDKTIQHIQFLKETINICIVDDDPQLLSVYSAILQSYGLYAILPCSSVSDAELLLQSEKRIHVCIMDLGLKNGTNDEFYLLKKYSSTTSFIVVTGKESITKGFDCGKYGSQSVFEKPVDFTNIDFLNAINNAFIYSLVCGSQFHKPVLESIIHALLTEKPSDMYEWSIHANVTEQYLRKIWNLIFGYQPKYFLWLYKTFNTAFTLYNTLFLQSTGSSDIPSHTRYLDEKDIAAIERYFYNNESIFNAILHKCIDSDINRKQSARLDCADGKV